MWACLFRHASRVIPVSPCLSVGWSWHGRLAARQGEGVRQPLSGWPAHCSAVEWRSVAGPGAIRALLVSGGRSDGAGRGRVRRLDVLEEPAVNPQILAAD